MTRLINNLAEVAHSYDALFVDLWGCLHNGITPFDEAVDALQAYKAQGGKVLLLTNSPKPKSVVAPKFAQLGSSREIQDEIACSGGSDRKGVV